MSKAIAQRPAGSQKEKVFQDVELGTTELKGGSCKIQATIHAAAGIGTDEPSIPLLVLPGFQGKAVDFSMLGNKLAAAGYTALILEQMPPQPEDSKDKQAPAPVLPPQAVGVAVDWLKANHNKLSDLMPGARPVDPDHVYLVGHSMGAFVAFCVLAEMSASQYTSYGVPGSENIKKIPGIKGAFFYGYSATSFSKGSWGHLQQKGQAVVVANGMLDPSSDHTRSTAQKMASPNAFMQLKDLDHFSIADRVWLDRPNEKLSSLPREEQVALVAGAAVAALHGMRYGSRGGAGEDTIPELAVRRDAVEQVAQSELGYHVQSWFRG